MKLRKFILIFAIGTFPGVAAVWMSRGPRTVAPPTEPSGVEPVAPAPTDLPPIAPEPLAAPEPPAAPPEPDASEPPAREQRSTPDRVTGVKSWLEEVSSDHVFDAARLEARPCFSSGDVEWIQARWEELDEKRRDLLDRLNEGEAPEGEQEWAELVDTLRGEIGEEGYNGFLYATHQYNGVQLSNLPRGSRAQVAGLKSGDQVIHYNGVRVHKPEALAALVLEENFSEFTDIEVRRYDGLIETVPIEPGPLGGIIRRMEVSPCPEELDWVGEKTGRRESVTRCLETPLGEPLLASPRRCCVRNPRCCRVILSAL